MIPGRWSVREKTLVAAAGVLGPAWIWHRRGLYRDIGEKLGGREAEVLSRYFSAPVMACVRVAEVAEIEEPVVFGVIRAMGVGVPMEMDTVSGMAFGDTVVLRRAGANRISTVFHEMVHVVQYRAMGLRGFAREYVKGWLNGGYRGVPLEVMAYELQARFDRGEVFEVEGEMGV